MRAKAARSVDKLIAPIPKTPPTPATKPHKLSYTEQRELDALPARIEAMEAEQKVLSALLADAAIYASDPARAAQTQIRHAIPACLEVGALLRET